MDQSTPETARRVLLAHGVPPAPVDSAILLRFEEAGLGDEFDEAARILAFRQVDELRRLLDTEPYDDEAVELFRTSLAGR